MVTPWGEAKRVKEFDGGNVVIVDTGDSGGVGIHCNVVELSESAKEIGEYYGGRVWFDEWYAFSVAVLEIPSVEAAYNSIYGGDMKVLALRIAKDHYPEYMDKEWEFC